MLSSGRRQTGETVQSESLPAERFLRPYKERVIRTVLAITPENERIRIICYSTFWIVVEKSSSVIVAELGFKGKPDKQGNIEIGYGSMPSHRGQGYNDRSRGRHDSMGEHQDRKFIVYWRKRIKIMQHPSGCWKKIISFPLISGRICAGGR